MNAEQAVLEAFERGKAFGFAEGMKSMKTDMNKPVAWIVDNDLKFNHGFDFANLQGQALYTHPTDLTDEEIVKTMVQFDVYSNDDQCLIEAGRAILRKAQEK